VQTLGLAESILRISGFFFSRFGSIVALRRAGGAVCARPAYAEPVATRNSRMASGRKGKSITSVGDHTL